MEELNIRKITFGGLMTAMVFAATAIMPHVPVPFTEGYIHIGDSMVFISAILLGWRFGAITGGLGSSLADLYLGYSHWAVPTLIIKGIMGAIVGYMAKELTEKDSKALNTGVTFASITIWIAFGLTIKNILSKILNGINNSEMTTFLINKLELNGTNELINLIGNVQKSLMLAIAFIPILVIVLHIILKKKGKKLFNITGLMGMTVAGLWMVVGYYISGGILKGNMIVPIFSVPANILQFVGGMVIASFAVATLNKVETINKYILKIKKG
ncbi:ECF transporter S component [Clostridiisalibacter paucivorans]|uniref:ECF transporter S component n=1 Tax=Clostridiisalibacter paucivorans TaxID=408753 RepID=UPI0006873346|nr:ECF transporter S component [Clostridiisalibacter paucivorans]